jgi:hypothetical protein
MAILYIHACNYTRMKVVFYFDFFFKLNFFDRNCQKKSDGSICFRK